MARFRDLFKEKEFKVITDPVVLRSLYLPKRKESVVFLSGPVDNMIRIVPSKNRAE